MRYSNSKSAVRGKFAHALIATSAFATLVGCSKGGGSFSTLETSQGFHQADAKINNKIDILWLVDNSGSMDPLQQRLADNFESFMTDFRGKGFDFQIAVARSDAYAGLPEYRNDPEVVAFSEGLGPDYSKVKVITPSTPNLIETFVKNAKVGAYGSGDERVFQSIFASITSPVNAGFLREGAFFAVVILSDEDDFSNPSRGEGAAGDHDYNQAGLVSVDSVVADLDALTKSTDKQKNYNVSAITVNTPECQAEHSKSAPSAIVGQRYIELANKTKGVIGSVCDDSFANSLKFIQQRIVELVSSFKLDREPKPDTIVVTVNGVNVPNSDTNGWTYSASENAIYFHGAAVPPASADVRIGFDPASFL